MSTTRLQIINGKIDQEHLYSRYINSYDENHFDGNGWVVTVTPERIFAICERYYSDGLNSISILLTKNIMTTTKKVGDKIYSKTVKKANYDGNGCLHLTGGNVRDRFGYWRNLIFQKFLKQYDLTAVNKLVLTDNIFKHDVWIAYLGYSLQCNIWSDSIQVTVDDSSEKIVPITIVNPTVVIVERVIRQEDYRSYLKTLYTNIKSIPEMEKSISKVKKVYEYKFRFNE